MKYCLPVGLALGALLALPAAAKEGDTFRPFVSMGYFYDSNLYRLPENENPSGLSALRDDRYSNLSAGINVDWKPGRQQIVANATKNWIRYDQNTRLDFDGDDLKAIWNWRLGSRLSGNLGAASSTTQSSFEAVGVVNNQVDRERIFGRIEWDYHPRWSIGGGLEEVDNTNSALSQISQDFEQQAYDVVLSYRTPKGSSLRTQVRRIDAEYPNPSVTGIVPAGFFYVIQLADNSFKQTEYNLLGDWYYSGKLTLRGQVGWVDRKYQNVLKDDVDLFFPLVPMLVSRSDFSGFAGRMSADWYSTGKTMLSMSVYRQPGAAGDINESSVLRTGASVNGVWLPREKWRLNAGVTYENRDFKGDAGTSLLPLHNDDTVGASLSLSYMPTQTISVDVGVRAGRRDSNRPVDDYTFHSLFANVRGDF